MSDIPRFYAEMVDGAVTCYEEGCDNDSSVLVTSTDVDGERHPYCTAHAHVVFADWMVGL